MGTPRGLCTKIVSATAENRIPILKIVEGTNNFFNYTFEVLLRANKNL
jgi:hypothetical protein